MKSIHTPMQSDDSRVYLAGNAGGFDLRNCPDYKQLAAFIVTACNAHDQLVADNAALRADLNDARSNWESGAEELRQADLVREQLVAALKIGRDVMALVGVQDHLIDYDAVSKGRKIVADALLAAPRTAAVGAGGQNG